METLHRDNCTVIRHTKGALPSVPFVRIKKAILGNAYELSVTFVGRKEAIALHQTWKHESTPANILSFPLSSSSGEIILSLDQARREAPKFGLSRDDYLVFLLIHGMVHLLGHDHHTRSEAETMEALEQKYRRLFGIMVTTDIL